MRRFLLIILICCPFLINAQQADIELLSDFIDSEDFSWFIKQSNFGKNARADLSRSRVNYEEYEGRKVPFLLVTIVREQADGTLKTAGEIEALKVRDGYDRLPREGRYLQVYKDLEEYDVQDGKGTIRLYDLNYDDYLFAELVVREEKVHAYKTYSMPDDIAKKYGFVSEKTGEETGKPHPCDGNQNGNVSFGECMSCMLNACLSNSECRKLCRITGIARCGSAFVISCTWIAIWY